MSTTSQPETAPARCPESAAPTLTAKQQRILRYLKEAAQNQTYFKSRLIAEELGMSAKEVGANMSPLVDGEVGLSVEKWGYSSGTTWMVTV